jgi:arsenate reductase (glutaredoxin)
MRRNLVKKVEFLICMRFFPFEGNANISKYSKYMLLFNWNIVDWMVNMLSLTFYCYPKCGTCRSAKKWLDAHNLSYNEVHIVESPPSKEEFKTLIDNGGFELKKFFNTSGQLYRELGLKDKVKTASEDELLGLLSTHGMLVKRPFLTDGKKATVGFKEEDFARNWL